MKLDPEPPLAIDQEFSFPFCKSQKKVINVLRNKTAQEEILHSFRRTILQDVNFIYSFNSSIYSHHIALKKALLISSRH